MDDITLYFSLMDGIGSSLQSSLAAIWFATEADLLAYGAIVIALFVLVWSLLTWAALNSAEARDEARDERERLRVWTLILLGVDVAALSKATEACPPPAVAATDAVVAETTDGAGADASTGSDARSDARSDAGRAA